VTLLSPLAEKSQSGAANDDIWDFLAVRAVIEYKWTHWAMKYMVFEFGLCLGWIMSYIVFLAIYIVSSLMCHETENMFCLGNEY